MDLAPSPARRSWPCMSGGSQTSSATSPTPPGCHWLRWTSETTSWTPVTLNRRPDRSRARSPHGVGRWPSASRSTGRASVDVRWMAPHGRRDAAGCGRFRRPTVAGWRWRWLGTRSDPGRDGAHHLDGTSTRTRHLDGRSTVAPIGHPPAPGQSRHRHPGRRGYRVRCRRGHPCDHLAVTDGPPGRRSSMACRHRPRCLTWCGRRRGACVRRGLSPARTRGHRLALDRRADWQRTLPVPGHRHGAWQWPAGTSSRSAPAAPGSRRRLTWQRHGQDAFAASAVSRRP